MSTGKPSGSRPKTREERLAEALRANLRRRKAAARDRQERPPKADQAPEELESMDESETTSGRS
jgi:hypothetical protein